MKATAEVQIIPLGSQGVSVRDGVARAHHILEEAGLKTELHAMGTNVEGDLRDILSAVAKIHEELHGDDIPRLSTHVKLSTRTDKEPSLADKVAAVKGS